MLGHLLKPEYEELIRKRDWESLRIALEDVDPADIAEILEDLPTEDSGLLFRVLPRDVAGVSFDVAQGVRKAGTTGKLEGLTLTNNVELLYNEPSKIAIVPFKGHMSNLSNVRDALRAWSMVRGYETTERAYEVWTGGIDAGFTGQDGAYEVVWAVK